MKNSLITYAVGILDIIAGCLIILGAFTLTIYFSAWLHANGALLVFVFASLIGGTAIGVLAIAGGDYILRRKKWIWALIGSVCAALVIFGIPAIIYTILFKKEFS